MTRFSPWQDELNAAPGGGAIVQVKVADRLLTYPTGKSAMVWYGALSDCTPQALAPVLASLRTAYVDDRLRWRCAVDSAPERVLERIRARFAARFGSFPGEHERRDP